jgi:short-subunit dehydrogenase
MPESARTLIVTGASSGIGRALALAAARQGFRLVITARRVPQLAGVADSIRSGGGTCVAVPGDVTARDMPAQIVAAALRELGRIDVLVNNAGLGAYGPLLEQNEAALEAQWQLHVAAPLRLARACLGSLEAVHGQIVFIGSGIARVPLPYYGSYALAKAAVRTAATQLRRELGSRGVAVTYVDPGIVASEFHSRLGIERSLPGAGSPQRAARAILRAIARRSAVVNAVPWQAAFITLGEWAGSLADPLVIARLGARRVGSESTPAPRHPEQIETPPPDFEKALEPVARRMERVKLPSSFLRDALVPGTKLELGSLAMRWAGMPNKNERAALREALDALTVGGYLERMEDETWKVLRAGD